MLDKIVKIFIITQKQEQTISNKLNDVVNTTIIKIEN